MHILKMVILVKLFVLSNTGWCAGQIHRIPQKKFYMNCMIIIMTRTKPKTGQQKSRTKLRN